MDIKRLNPTPRWSDAVVFNRIAHFVEVPADTSADIGTQITQLLQQAESTLMRINSDKSRLLSATIYLTDFANLDTFNSAWEAWLPFGMAPSRACIKAELVNPDMLIEIAFVAATRD